MYNIDAITNKCDKLYEKNLKVKNCLLIIQRYYSAFLFTGSRRYIERAYYLCSKTFRNNPRDIRVFMLMIFLNIKTGNMKETENDINKLSESKNWFKANSPLLYGLYLYLSSIYFIEADKIRIFIRNYNRLVEYADEVEDMYVYEIAGILSIEAERYDNAIIFFDKSYNKGSRSIYLYWNLYKLMESRNNSFFYSHNLITAFFNWAVSHKVDISNIIDKYDDKILLNFYNYRSIGFKLYKSCKQERILIELCTLMIKDADYSKNAYYYYKEACDRQIYIKGLNNFYIKSAYMLKVEDIGLYPLKTYLQEEKIDSLIKPYLYHIIITNKKCRSLLEIYFNDIVEFGISSIKNKCEGRYYFSIYKYILDNEYKITAINKEILNYIEIIENILYENLFLYNIKVKNNNASYCWLKEKEKNELSFYNINNNEVIISASNDCFSLYFTDYFKKSIEKCSIDIIRFVENADIKLFIRFYSKGYISDNIIIAITKYYLQRNKISENVLSILKSALEIKTISREFKIKINGALGNYYYINNNYSEAVKYYLLSNEKYLNGLSMENMLQAYIKTKNFEKALNLMTKYSNSLSDDILFKCVKEMLYDNKYTSMLSDISYKLVLKKNFDDKILQTVLDFYEGSFDDWIKLNDVLYEIDKNDKRVEERLIENIIVMNKFDENTQKIYYNVYKNNPESECLKKFTEYLCVKLLYENKKPNLKTIEILEDIFIKTKDSFIAIALSNVYITYDIRTLNTKLISDTAKQYMEKENILFPHFKKCKDKLFTSAYIEKNQTFIYMASSNKTILFYYRLKGDDNFICEKMRRLKYGVNMIVMPVFYGEEVEYYFSEQMNSGSIETKTELLYNGNMFLHDNNEDSYFDINNAVIYSKMFKYENVETIINSKLKKADIVRGKLL